MKNKIIYSLLLLVIVTTTYSQHISDTVALIKDINKVMGFSVKPYVYYSVFTHMDAVPVLQTQDTATTKGVFYKNGENIYYNSGAYETYMQDSLIIEINTGDRKTIWIRKFDAATKENMKALPELDKRIRDLMRRKYVINKSEISKGVTRLHIETKEALIKNAAVSTILELDYINKSYLPKQINVQTFLRQPVDEETIASMQLEVIDKHKLIQVIDSVQYIVRRQ
ncbi:MAG: hypothetical protein HY305_07795, partial [Sphingobacteriales bacterium]|nr:hypothetical protein [Sphingobacteriales bacterium]